LQKRNRFLMVFNAMFMIFYHSLYEYDIKS
jgi:hypothetical protein